LSDRAFEFEASGVDARRISAHSLDQGFPDQAIGAGRESLECAQSTSFLVRFVTLTAVWVAIVEGHVPEASRW